MKKQKGITLISLVLVIALMGIISLTIISNTTKSFENKDLNNMYNDIQLLNDKIAIFYSKYNALPIYSTFSNISVIPSSQININDNNIYYIINLSALDGITLNYGSNYNAINNNFDAYIINEKTHTIYYPHGIVSDNITYYTIP